MKKALKELNIEEFTRLLCDWPATYTISLKFFNKETEEIEEDTVIGTYDDLSECTLSHEQLHKWVEENLYDYQTPVGDLELYDYLSEKTHGFDKERVSVVLNEMDCWHLIYISEEKQEYAMKQYEENKWKLPVRPLFTDHEDESNKHFSVDQDAMVKKVFGPADEFLYKEAIALLKSKEGTIKQKFEGLQTDEFINLLFGYVPNRIKYLTADPFFLGSLFLIADKELEAIIKKVEPNYTKTEYVNYLKGITNNFDKEETKDLVESLEESARLTYSNMCKLSEEVFDHAKRDKSRSLVGATYIDRKTEEEKCITNFETEYDYMLYRSFGDKWANRYVTVIDILTEKTGIDFSDGEMYHLCKGFGKTDTEIEQPANDPGTTEVSPDSPINRNDPEYKALAGLFDTTQFDKLRIDKLYRYLKSLKGDRNAHNAIAALAEQFIRRSYSKKKKMRQVVSVLYPIAGVDERWVARIRIASVGKSIKNNARREWYHISQKEKE